MTDLTVITHADDCWSWGPGHYKCAVREIERLRAENERLRKDAERYRWLRKQCGNSGLLTIAKVGAFELKAWSGDDPDAAIDAAMRKENSND